MDTTLLSKASSSEHISSIDPTVLGWNATETGSGEERIRKLIVKTRTYLGSECGESDNNMTEGIKGAVGPSVELRTDIRDIYEGIQRTSRFACCKLTSPATCPIRN